MPSAVSQAVPFEALADTPHPWLFPRTSRAIDRGGAGTTHTAARAGVPAIALPVGAALGHRDGGRERPRNGAAAIEITVARASS